MVIGITEKARVKNSYRYCPQVYRIGMIDLSIVGYICSGFCVGVFFFAIAIDLYTYILIDVAIVGCICSVLCVCVLVGGGGAIVIDLYTYNFCPKII